MHFSFHIFSFYIQIYNSTYIFIFFILKFYLYSNSQFRYQLSDACYIKEIFKKKLLAKKYKLTEFRKIARCRIYLGQNSSEFLQEESMKSVKNVLLFSHFQTFTSAFYVAVQTTKISTQSVYIPSPKGVICFLHCT